MNKLMAMCLLVLLPWTARAAEECNGFINISYPNSQIVNQIGDKLQVKVDLGAGTITGGPANVLLLGQMGFDLSCADPPGPLPNCPSEGPVMSYDGDASIVTNCPGTLTSNNPAGGPAPAHLVFTFQPTVSIPNGTPIPPAFCSFTFTETILSQTSNATGVIEQVIGYDIALCDNGVLLSGGFQTGSVPVEQPGNFDCYQVPRGRFSPEQTVQVVNQFGDLTVQVNTLHRLCAPSTVDGNPPGVNFNGIHLAAYDIKSFTGTISHDSVSVATQFGVRTGTVGNLIALALPTAKSLVGLPPSPPVGIVPPYACYRLTNSKGPAPKGLTTVDQFATTPLDIGRRGPFTLCVSTQLGPLPPDGQPSALLCNRTLEDVNFGTESPFITNLFQSTRVTISQFDELCVPAVLQ